MNEAVAVLQKDLPTRGAVTPMDMIQMAVQQGADIEKLSRLMDLQERWEKNEAKKAYHQAFAAFKGESVAVLRNTPVSAGPLAGKFYADLYAVVNAVTPALSQHGLSASWRLSKDEKDWLEVTCTITHTLGHSESVSMGATPDTGGAKNAIQARASTVTYLERYTLMSATGLASQGQDTDGNTKGKSMPESQFADFLAAIEASADIAGLQKSYSEAYKTADAAGDKPAMQAFMAAKDKRKRELGK